MTEHALVTRRMVVRDMGRAGLAVMILGTAARSSDPAEPSPSAAGSAAREPGAGQWHRVNASVEKLAGFDCEVALFGHGEPVTSGASNTVAELANSLNGG